MYLSNSIQSTVTLKNYRQMKNGSVYYLKICGSQKVSTNPGMIKEQQQTNGMWNIYSFGKIMI